ncbi:MAG: hypothetical protein WD733_21245 [Bryobacterales bacterium]
MRIRVNPEKPEIDRPAEPPISRVPAAVPVVSETPSVQNYLLSLPERAIRSVAGVSAGLLRELGDAALPVSVRRTRLYGQLVEVTLRFLIEQVGQVEGAYEPVGKLSGDFLQRRTVGNGLELLGIVAFRASPVWVMAALADLSGGGRKLIREIAGSLKQEGLLEPGHEFATVDQILDGLERTSGRLAETINTPPLDVAALREEWTQIRRDAASIAPSNLPSMDRLWSSWNELRAEAAEQKRSVFEVSSLLALSAVGRLPENVRWLSRSARTAARRTGQLVAGTLLDHYSLTLREIREAGFVAYWSGQFRPYLKGAAAQFSRQKPTLTERFLKRQRVSK